MNELTYLSIDIFKFEEKKVDGGKNAGILAASIVSTFDDRVAEYMTTYKKQLTDKVMRSVDDVATNGWK